jgi:hypothetical protein
MHKTEMKTFSKQVFPICLHADQQMVDDLRTIADAIYKAEDKMPSKKEVVKRALRAFAPQAFLGAQVSRSN